MRIDTHLHTWERSRSAYAWLREGLPIARDILGEEAIAASRAAGFDAQILVQADDSMGDAEHMLEVAAAHDSVLGIVPWVPLAAPDIATVLLERWGPPVVGVRVLAHIDPDPELLLRRTSGETLSVLEASGLPFEIPDAWPGLLDQVPVLAREHETLVIVLDHLAKPPVEPEAMPSWRRALAAAADCPTTVAKLSGLHHGGRLLRGDALQVAWEAAIECLGPDRLMLGTDFPMPELGDGAAAAAEQLADLLGALSDTERAAIECGTARRVYRRSA